MFEGISSSAIHGPGATPWRSARITSRPLAARRLEPGSLHDSGHMLTEINRLASGAAPPYLLRRGIKAGVELRSAVECRHNHVPALTALRVIPVVTHDVTPQGVVVGVHPAHDVSLASAGTQTQPAGGAEGRSRDERRPDNVAGQPGNAR
jgi:hypothetical protein